MEYYEEVGLPGAVGSVDVVHVRWANCPAGDFNRSKGKESYPSLAFQCITDLDRKNAWSIGSTVWLSKR